MNHKLLSTIDAKRIVAKGIVIDMAKEISECLRKIESSLERENCDQLIARKHVFIGTVEEELKLSDKITMYSYARGLCLGILHERKYNIKIRSVAHLWCMELEKYIPALLREKRANDKASELKALLKEA